MNMNYFIITERIIEQKYFSYYIKYTDDLKRYYGFRFGDECFFESYREQFNKNLVYSIILYKEYKPYEDKIGEPYHINFFRL